MFKIMFNFKALLLPCTAFFAAVLLCTLFTACKTGSADAESTASAAEISGTHDTPDMHDTSVTSAVTAKPDTESTNAQAASEENLQPALTNADNAENSPSPADSSSENRPVSSPDTYVGKHGALSVQNGQLTDKNGEAYQLYGMSTHGIAWFPQYINYDAFCTLRDDWNTNCVRLAMYTAEYGGYCSGGDQNQLKQLIKDGVEYASDLGMYVIIDWHVLNDCDPNVYKAEAAEFFGEMSALYADNENVLYEICNEPNGYASWDSIKAYAEEIIPIIRANDPDSVIIVGTPTWSQDIDKAAENPLEFDNVMYALHFYAATHQDDLRNRLKTCAENGLPVFISEFGMCDASGNGANDFDSATEWLELIEEYKISFCCWNLANKAESSSVFKSDSSALSHWTAADLSEAGNFIRNYFRGRQ